MLIIPISTNIHTQRPCARACARARAAYRTVRRWAFGPHHRYWRHCPAAGATAATAGAVGSIIGPLLASGLILVLVPLGLGERAAPWLLVPLTAGLAILLVRGIGTDPRDVSRRLGDWFPGSAAAPETGAARSRRELLRIGPARAAIVTAALIQAAMVGVMGVTAVVLDEQGLGAAAIGIFISAHFLGMFGLAAPLGRLADRVGRRRMLLAGIVGTAIGAVGTAMLGESLLILPFFFLLGRGWCSRRGSRSSRRSACGRRSTRGCDGCVAIEIAACRRRGRSARGTGRAG